MPNSSKQLKKAGMDSVRLFSSVLLLLVAAYRTLGTLFFGGACRFEPSCSEYAVSALKSHHPMFAIHLIVRRIVKCRPGGDFGFDPVPQCQSCQRKISEVKGIYGAT